MCEHTCITSWSYKEGRGCVNIHVLHHGATQGRHGMCEHLLTEAASRSEAYPSSVTWITF